MLESIQGKCGKTQEERLWFVLSDCTQEEKLLLCISWSRINILTWRAGEKKARSMHGHSHGDLRCVPGAVAAESYLNAGDYVSFLLQVELNQAMMD